MAEDTTITKRFSFQNGRCYLPLPTDPEEKNILWKFLVLAHLCEQCGKRYYWVNNVTEMSILCDNPHEHYAGKTRTVKIELHVTDAKVEAKEEEQQELPKSNYLYN